MPFGLGFALPAALLLRMAWSEGDAQFGPRFLQLAGNSMLLAGGTAVLAVAMALLIGYASPTASGGADALGASRGRPGLRLAGNCHRSGRADPGDTAGQPAGRCAAPAICWQTGLWFTGTIAALVYARLVRFRTAAVQSVDAGLARITPHMDDAARSLGHGPWATLKRVHLPLLRGSAMTAGLLVFIDVMKEFVETVSASLAPTA